MKHLKKLEVLHLVLLNSCDAFYLVSKLHTLPQLTEVVILYHTENVKSTRNSEATEEKHIGMVMKYLELHPQVVHFEFSPLIAKKVVDRELVPQFHRYAKL